MNIKDEIKALKNELRNHEYYLKQYKIIDEKINDMWYKIGGVSGVDPSKISLENHNQSNAEERRLDMLERIDQLQAKKNSIEERIKNVEKILSKIEDDMLGPITDIYVKGKTFQFAAIKYNTYPSYLEYRINKNLADIIKKGGGI